MPSTVMFVVLVGIMVILIAEIKPSGSFGSVPLKLLANTEILFVPPGFNWLGIAAIPASGGSFTGVTMMFTCPEIAA